MRRRAARGRTGGSARRSRRSAVAAGEEGPVAAAAGRTAGPGCQVPRYTRRMSRIGRPPIVVTRAELFWLTVGLWMGGVCLLALLPVVLMPRLGPALGLGAPTCCSSWLAAAAANHAARPGPAGRVCADAGARGHRGDRRLLRARGAARARPPRGMTLGGGGTVRRPLYSGRARARHRLRSAANRAGPQRRRGTLASPWRVLERPPSEPETVRLVCRRNRPACGRRRRTGGGRRRLAAPARRLAQRADAASSRRSRARSQAAAGVAGSAAGRAIELARGRVAPAAQ